MLKIDEKNKIVEVIPGDDTSRCGACFSKADVKSIVVGHKGNNGSSTSSLKLCLKCRGVLKELL